MVDTAAVKGGLASSDAARIKILPPEMLANTAHAHLLFLFVFAVHPLFIYAHTDCAEHTFCRVLGMALHFLLCYARWICRVAFAFRKTDAELSVGILKAHQNH